MTPADRRRNQCMRLENWQGDIPIQTGKKDRNGNKIRLGDILENRNGTRFEVRYGIHAMYCPVDDCMMENVGFYVVAEGYYEDMPLGPTEEYAVKTGNVSACPELKIGEEYRCPAELERAARLQQ